MKVRNVRLFSNGGSQNKMESRRKKKNSKMNPFFKKKMKPYFSKNNPFMNNVAKTEESKSENEINRIVNSLRIRDSNRKFKTLIPNSPKYRTEAPFCSQKELVEKPKSASSRKINSIRNIILNSKKAKNNQDRVEKIMSVLEIDYRKKYFKKRRRKVKRKIVRNIYSKV